MRRRIQDKADSLGSQPARLFRVVAWLKKGDTTLFFVNDKSRTSPSYKRIKGDRCLCYDAHAESLACTHSKKFDSPDLYVTRYLATGQVTMAKPCKHCQIAIKRTNIKRVFYTDWDGNWQRLIL